MRSAERRSEPGPRAGTIDRKPHRRTGASRGRGRDSRQRRHPGWVRVPDSEVRMRHEAARTRTRTRTRTRVRVPRRGLVERRLRLWSGLLIAAYVVLHLANHAFGLISIEAMERAREVDGDVVGQSGDALPALRIARGPFRVGACRALSPQHPCACRCGRLRSSVWGLLVVPLIAGHVTGTRGSQELLGIDVDYPLVLGAIWTDDFHLARQTVLLLVVWLHVVVGLHFWASPQVVVRQGPSVPLCSGAAAAGPVPARLRGIRSGGAAPDSRGGVRPRRYSPR